MIELGRSRPWVIFTGLPYPAALRLFGDAGEVAAFLSFSIIAPIILAAFFTKNPEKVEKLKNIKRNFLPTLIKAGENSFYRIFCYCIWDICDI